jgi:uncharacterized delta-60 repeat protein
MTYTEGLTSMSRALDRSSVSHVQLSFRRRAARSWDKGLIEAPRRDVLRPRTSRAKRSALLLATIVSLTPAFRASAAGGDLDTTFGSNGRVTTDFGKQDRGRAVAMDLDGRIVAAGASGNQLILARYTVDGLPDATFGSGGSVTVGAIDSATDVLIQPDHKIIAIGTATIGSGQSDFAVVRFDPDGIPDPSFSGDGIQTTAFDVLSVAHSAALQPDGKIVVAGYTSDQSNSRIAVARYRIDGTLDPTFSGDGEKITAFNRLSFSGASAVAIQPNGKLVVAGSAFVAQGRFLHNAFALVRYLPDGSLDPLFGRGGKVRVDFGRRGRVDAAVGSMAIQEDGKIDVAGTAQTFDVSGTADFALARVKHHGALDPTFGGDGKVRVDFKHRDDGATGIGLQANGKIVASGLATSSVGAAFGTARVRTDGRLDPRFGGGDGKVLTRVGDEGSGSDCLVNAGKILVVGSERVTPGNWDFALVRYLTR